MCGIFGYYNYDVPQDRAKILALLFQGLRRLEYRGYDSAGIAVDRGEGERDLEGCGSAATAASSAGDADAGRGGEPEGLLAPCSPRNRFGVPLVVKAVGKVAALEAKAHWELASAGVPLTTSFTNHVGIAHTRWATHGQPSEDNSHPHRSSKACEFVVVHNGIITNHAALKEFLTKHGEVFETDTDTEVIPKLCRYIHRQLSADPNRQGDLLFSEVVMEVMNRLEGAYALLFKSTFYPGELVACKQGSPLVMGVRSAAHAGPAAPAPGAELPLPMHRLRHQSDVQLNEFCRTEPLELFLASDTSAVVEHTQKVVILEDSDVVAVKGGRYGIFNRHTSQEGAAVERLLETMTADLTSIMKGGYDHFMQKEIHEQPESLTQTMRGRVVPKPKDCADPYKLHRIKLGGMQEFLPAMKRCRRIMLVGCGTSYHACLASRPTLEEMSDTPVTLELASDLMDRQCPIFRDDVCIFLSQSGETADTLAALNYAKARGALCVGVTNVVGSALSRASDCGVHLNAGYEIGVASTKAYTSQILAVAMIALLLGDDAVSKRAAVHRIADGMAVLPEAVRKALQLDGQMRALAAQLKDHTSLLFFGRGYNYATALEAALKVKEVALIHSEGILAGEMKHGPLALVDENLPLLVIATKDAMHSKMRSVIAQLRARAGHLIVVCNEDDTDLAALEDATCRLVQVPHVVDALQPVVNIVPCQLLSYHLTVLRGHNVDQPRNLAKSVTVTEE